MHSMLTIKTGKWTECRRTIMLVIGNLYVSIGFSVVSCGCRTSKSEGRYVAIRMRTTRVVISFLLHYATSSGHTGILKRALPNRKEEADN